MSDTSLTILNDYALKGTGDDFLAAIKQLAARVEREGQLGVRSYRFFLNASDNSARAIVDYENSEAWIGHHEIAMAWPEMAQLHAVATLVEVTFLGPLTPEIRSWIEGSTLSARIRHGYALAAGFRR